MQSILVVGGAGYIGSHMVLALKNAGYHVVVLDNLSKGYRTNVSPDSLVVGDMADTDLLNRLFTQYCFSAVMHFASFIEVAESVKDPKKYYQNNVINTFNLFNVMLKHHVKKIIFSSSAAVYGEPHYTPIDEAHPLNPINPYGRTKKIVEDMIQDLAQSDGLQYAILRYFNAAGADPDGLLGEQHEPESHLIPLVLQVAEGRKAALHVYGCDYETKDGTCIRDYVHVVDLCEAHLLALKALQAGHNSMIYNLGTGCGYSVQEVIDTAKKITGQMITTLNDHRRPGDPAILVADASKAKKELNWNPQYDLSAIVHHAWQFCCRNKEEAHTLKRKRS